MNNGILPLGGPKAPLAPLLPFSAIEVLHVHDQIQTLLAFNQNLLLYDVVVTDLFSAYDTITGTFTVPAGQGGLYAVFMSLAAGGATAGADSCNIGINTTNGGDISINGGGTYAVVDQYMRFGGMMLVQLEDGEDVVSQVYPTADLTPLNAAATFNTWRLYKLS